MFNLEFLKRSWKSWPLAFHNQTPSQKLNSGRLLLFLPGEPKGFRLGRFMFNYMHVFVYGLSRILKMFIHPTILSENVM